jgi:hypothetical protein
VADGSTVLKGMSGKDKRAKDGADDEGSHVFRSQLKGVKRTPKYEFAG